MTLVSRGKKEKKKKRKRLFTMTEKTFNCLREGRKTLERNCVCATEREDWRLFLLRGFSSKVRKRRRATTTRGRLAELECCL